MNLILSAVKIIGRIVEKDIPLGKAAKEHFSVHYYTKEDRKIIKALVVVALKHDNVLGRIVLDNFPSIGKEEKRFLIVALANVIFVKKISLDETTDEITSLISNEHISFALLEKFIHQRFDTSNLVPPYVILNSTEYFNLKYNIPVWLIDMWGKHYGRALLPRLLSSIDRKYVPTLRVNKSIINRREIYNNYPSLFENGISETTVKYLGTKTVSKIDAVRRGELIPISESLNHVVNRLSIKASDDVLIVADTHSSFSLALGERFNSRNKILYALSSYEETIDAKKAIRSCGFNQFDVVESPLNLLVTHISEAKDFVVVLPTSSNFQSISSIPDFFLHFSAEKLDSIISRQAEYLEESSVYVKDGGHLLYVIETGNNKEGSLQIKYFLESHKDFSLVEERQMLPLDKRGGFCYFALLKKGGTK